ncbi:MAG: agmatine deiminase family protein [Planctomycetes bacterium]|nr:agmatine deiminase family protein [Planctomycetota bacterium]
MKPHLPFLLLILSSLSASLLAQTCPSAASGPPGSKNLPIGFAPGERDLSHRIGMNKATTNPPIGPATAAAEWAESNGVFCHWSNAELMNELQKENDLFIITTNAGWWNSWLASNGIPTTNVHYLNAPTDSLYVRDFGPWFIWDANQMFGLVDNIYNRPRPLDDVIPGIIAATYGIRYYGMDLIHTGGNYYTDGFGNAWSTRLVYKENPSKTEAEVNQIMADYLGIERYVTPEISYTIEHFDTFGKILAPDSMIWGEFPVNTTPWYYCEAALAYYQTLQCPYGWPYKIRRMPLWDIWSSWTAYINGLQTQDKLLICNYSLPSDAIAKQIYEEAAPGYRVINVGNGGTTWGDSIHCRTRNFVRRDAIRIYAQPHWESTDDVLNPYPVAARVIPDNSTALSKNPEIHWTRSGGAPFQAVSMTPTGNPHEYAGTIPAQPLGTRIDYFIHAEDLASNQKNEPLVAPSGMFTIQIESDVEPPDLQHLAIHGATPAEWPLTIECTATDNTGIPAVTLEYSIKGVPQPAVTLAQDEGTFRFSALMTGSAALNDLISYRIVAQDGASPSNVRRAPTDGWNYFKISASKPIAVIDLDKSPDSGPVLAAACDDLGLSVRYLSAWPASLGTYQAALICLGMNPTKGSLTSSQANGLVSFLNAGGNAYLEGGNCFAQDSSSSIYRASFGIASASAGSAVSSSVTGAAGTITAGMTFGYYGENDSSDHLTPAASALAVLHDGSDAKAVTYSTGTFRTAALSLQIADLVDGAHPSHGKLLAARLLEHLGFAIDLVAHVANNDPTKYAVDVKGDANANLGLCVSYGPGYRPLPQGLMLIDTITMLPPIIATLDGSGEFHAEYPVPALPSLDGVELYFQAWLQDMTTGQRYLTNRDRVTYHIS